MQALKYYHRFLFTIVLLLNIVISGCDGGGGSNSASSGVITLGPSTAKSDATLTITNTSLQFGQTTAVTGTFKNSNGTAAVGIPVNFSTTLGTITPASGAVTDSNGVATVSLTAGSDSGQGLVTASATVENNQVTKTALFSVSLPPLHLSTVSVDTSPLSYGGSTSVSVTVLDANNLIYTDQAVDVVFTSTQTAAGKASVSSPVKTVNGVATSTYKADTVTGTDTISASISGSTKTADIVVNPLSAGAIVFVSAAPTNIALNSMGGLGYTMISTVTFQVLDSTGQPKPNQSVTFSPNTTVGGLSLTQLTGSTDSQGRVSTQVNSGNVATPVRVKATITGSSPAISTQSDQLTISTGLPTQNGMSVAFGTLNSESFNTDGVVVPVTVSLSDHFGNPVPDGTAVSLTAQSGLIDPSCTTGSGGIHGVCTVNWRSGGFRPTTPSKGKNAILVYAIGEESFTDSDGNGLAGGPCAAGQPLIANLLCGEFTDTLQAWRDDNYNLAYDLGTDPFIDFNGSGKVDRDAKFDGVLVSSPATTPLKHVFKNPYIIMSTSDAKITATAGATTPDTIDADPETISITVTDANTNQMPAGTTITLTATTGALSSTSFIVPNTTAAPEAFDVIWSITKPATVSGSVTISVKSPAGVVTTKTIPISGTF